MMTEMTLFESVSAIRSGFGEMSDWYKRRGYEDYADYDDPAFVWMWKPL